MAKIPVFDMADARILKRLAHAANPLQDPALTTGELLVFVGKTTVVHPQGETKPVDIMVGPKGEEDQVIKTLQVYNRDSGSLGVGETVKVVNINKGPEILSKATGSVSIWFMIDYVLCPARDYVEEVTLIVTVINHTGGCDSDAPGADDYGVYRVYAFCENDLAGLTEEDLVGSKGKATYSQTRTDGYECTGKYLIDFLCAQPECA